MDHEPIRGNMIGQRFGRLVITGHAPRYVSPSGKSRMSRYYVKCDCGNDHIVRRGCLLSGHATSCGCFLKERAGASRERHGHGRAGKETATYIVWKNMLARCRPNHKQAKNYYYRGITVCDRWLKFENFLADMGERPEGMTLDRENNDQGYEKSNCRWVTTLVQQRNRSDNYLVTYNGKNIPISEASELTGINSRTIWYRLKRGWSIERALSNKNYKFAEHRSPVEAA